jgi:hypothetical protein
VVTAAVPLRVNKSWSLELNPKFVVVLAPKSLAVTPRVPRFTHPDQVNTVELVGVVNVLLK